MLHILINQLKSKFEHLVILDELPLVDYAICQHGPPGAPQVVVGVQDIGRCVDGVTGGHLTLWPHYDGHTLTSSP